MNGRSMKASVTLILKISIFFNLSRLSSCCQCDGYTDTSLEPTVFESQVLPEEECCRATVGNGYLATTVYTNTICKNGLYNGRDGESDRARIPSTAAIMMQQSEPELRDVYWVDVLNVRRQEVKTSLTGEMIKDKFIPAIIKSWICPYFFHSLIIIVGTFFHVIETSQAYIEQRLYAHQVLTRLLVNEITIRRKSGTETTEPVVVKLSTNQGPESDDIDFTVTPPPSEGEPWSSSGMTKISETVSSSTLPVFTYWTDIPDNITLVADIDSKTCTYITSISDAQDDARMMYDTGLDQSQTGDLFKNHIEAWTKIWSKGRINVSGNLKLSKAIYASMYYILSSLPPVDYTTTYPFQFYGLSPAGLATGGFHKDYRGHVFWDQETWMYPTMLILYPELARAMLRYRTMQLEAAKQHAAETSEQGARYPWESAYTGFEVCPGPKYAELEIHINGDISFAVQQYLYATNDTDFLINDNGFEMVKELAKYWAGRVTYDEEKQAYTILGVMPPDEHHAPVNNSVYTNVVAQMALRLPYYAASLLGEELPDTWSQIADNMYIIYDGENDYHPEFEGYERDTIVKQADAILLGYPLMYDMDLSTRANDLSYYEANTEHTGPAMTWGMFAVGWLELGDAEKAEDLFARNFLNIREPFKIWTETAQGSSSDAVNFITGMGGFLQAVLMGYGGLRLHNDSLTMKITLPEDTLQMTFTGINYLGNSLDVIGVKDMTTLELTEQDEGAVQLALQVANDVFFPLEIGTSIRTNDASIKIVPYTNSADSKTLVSSLQIFCTYIITSLVTFVQSLIT